MKLRYYQVKATKEYLAVDHSKLYKGIYSGRVANISNDPNSVITDSVAAVYLLEDCKEVRKSNVPKKWLEQF